VGAGWERRAEAFCREVQDRVDLFAGDGELLHHFFHGQARFQILEDSGYRHAGVLKHPGAAYFAGDALHRWALGPVEG